MTGVITKSWSFTSAQTDLSLETVGGTQRMALVYANFICANSNTGDVSVRMGFAASTLPAVGDNSATGADAVFFSHGGIAPGGGAVASNGGSLIAVGGYGIGPRLTCSAATGGSLRIVMSWQLLD